MTALIILKLFINNKDIYNRYNSYINTNNISKEYNNILIVIKDYYNKFEEHNYLSSDELRSWFHHCNPTIKDKEVYDSLFDRLSTLDISTSVAEEVVTNLIEKEYANKLINVLIPVIEDSAFRILNTEGKKLIEEFEEVCQLKTEGEKNLFIDDDLDAILSETILGEGLSWRLRALNESVGQLRGSSLGHIFARPDAGKTSFLASEVTFIASQLADNECILWINNEEKGSKVKLRTYQAILNADTKSIVANIEKAKTMYVERGGGKIKLYDSATVSIREIKKLLHLYNPKVVVIDQGDKVSFPKDGDYSNTDRLQRLYQMYRELAKQYNTNILTVGQASGEAEGKKWLTLDMMNNSKTGKPGELDYAIGIGNSYGEGDEEFRYIHVCKNKYGAHAKHTVIFDAEKSRYRDV